MISYPSSNQFNCWPVKVMTEFRTLDDGAFYPALTIVETEIKEKKLVMKTENFDFLRRGG